MIRPRPQPSMPQWSQKLYEKAIFKSLHWSGTVLSPPCHDVAKKFMKRPISNFYNNSNSTDFFENVSYKTEILQNNSWQISQKCMLQEFKIVLIRETRWLQNLSRSWPFLSLPSFSFCFILSFAGFNFSSRYCVSGACYSWILQKKSCRISYWNFWSQKHLALDIWDFKTWNIVHAQRPKEKEF